jgi:hypothetical protein
MSNSEFPATLAVDGCNFSLRDNSQSQLVDSELPELPGTAQAAQDSHITYKLGILGAQTSYF